MGLPAPRTASSWALSPVLVSPSTSMVCYNIREPTSSQKPDWTERGLTHSLSPLYPQNKKDSGNSLSSIILHHWAAPLSPTQKHSSDSSSMRQVPFFPGKNLKNAFSPDPSTKHQTSGLHLHSHCPGRGFLAPTGTSLIPPPPPPPWFLPPATCGSHHSLAQIPRALPLACADGLSVSRHVLLSLPHLLQETLSDCPCPH